MSRDSGDADSSGLLTKVRFQSGLSVRADQYHTALFGPPEPETSFETPHPILSARLSSNISFYSLFQGVDEVVKPHLSFPSLDNGTLVDQQLPS
ncbi:hypothetical protein AVEN_262916-1 [Araneus ventricosus]|uniref:Uncharacterized protein n=1 Tax=Araneus ventricosus TaxID=182803 RepID=A0A4Y2DHR3_ARAVE|nr:hypothetical protein AVEN_262916-1 [Araneus ventricosus]